MRALHSTHMAVRLQALARTPLSWQLLALWWWVALQLYALLSLVLLHAVCLGASCLI